MMHTFILLRAACQIFHTKNAFNHPQLLNLTRNTLRNLKIDKIRHRKRSALCPSNAAVSKSSMLRLIDTINPKDPLIKGLVKPTLGLFMEWRQDLAVRHV